MKKISPISPPEEVVPEPGPPQFASTQLPASAAEQSVPQPFEAQPAAAPPEQGFPPTPPADSATSEQAPTEAAPEVTGEQAPAQTAPEAPAEPVKKEPEFYQSISSLYPEPMTSGERIDARAKIYDNYPSSKGFAISQYLIPLIVVIYAAHNLWQIIKALTNNSLYSMGNFLNGSGVFGGFSSYLWALLISALIMYSLLIWASYKLFRGSKVALGFVSGASIMVLPQILVSLIFVFPELGTFIKIPSFTIQLVAALLLALMLILAWTREKHSYS